MSDIRNEEAQVMNERLKVNRTLTSLNLGCEEEENN